jgi:hypothetical protein
VLEQRLPGRFRGFAPDSWKSRRLLQDLLSFWHARSRRVVLARIHRSIGDCREEIVWRDVCPTAGWFEGKRLSKFGIEKRLRQIRVREL